MNEENIKGIYLERITFSGRLAENIRSLKSPDGPLLDMFPEIERGHVSRESVIKAITAFYAGLQYSYDKMEGEKSMPKIWIGEHRFKGKVITKPAYASDYGILLPRQMVLNVALKPDTYIIKKISGEGKYIGDLPIYAWMGEGGAEEMVHAIQDQQGRLDEFEGETDFSGTVPGYNKRPHEQEALVFRNSFLNDICDIKDFFKDEIVQN